MQDPDRVVSLAPSATATITAVGAADRLVGVTAHCDADAPTVGGWLTADADYVAEYEPDLVCTADPLQRDLRDRLRDGGMTVHHVEPTTLSGVFDAISAVARAVGRPDAGDRLVETLRGRVRRVREATPDDGPVVYCEEWGDPPTAAGNWVPDAVRAAGCRYPFVTAGERSTEVSRTAIERAEPSHAVVHHCGHGDHAAPSLFADRGWELDAAVHVVDDDLLNQPSPRLVDGIERLAELIHGVPVG